MVKIIILKHNPKARKWENWDYPDSKTIISSVEVHSWPSAVFVQIGIAFFRSWICEYDVVRQFVKIKCIVRENMDRTPFSVAYKGQVKIYRVPRQGLGKILAEKIQSMVLARMLNRFSLLPNNILDNLIEYLQNESRSGWNAQCDSSYFWTTKLWFEMLFRLEG